MTQPGHDLLPFYLPDIGDDEVRAVSEALRSNWLTSGPRVRQFEQDFAAYTGAEHAVAVNSGTAALHLALDAVGIREGDEVIVPTMTFTATAEVVLYFKARPVLVDCGDETGNIDPAAIDRAITPRTRAIIPVHLAGHPCAMDEILEIARRRGLRVIEDAAHALPASYRGRRVGTIGDLTCFSFYATKTITTGEGGMITTNNVEYPDRMRIMSLHGISKDAWNRYAAEGSWFYEVIRPGYKYNLTDLAAALGIVQLRRSTEFWEKRCRLAALYQDGLGDAPGIDLPTAAADVQHAWHLYIIRLDPERLRIGRNEFIQLLKDEGIGTSVHFIPLHLHPFYRDTLGYRREDFPVAGRLFERIISLPIYPKMSPRDVARVCNAVRAIAERHRR